MSKKGKKSGGVHKSKRSRVGNDLPKWEGQAEYPKDVENHVWTLPERKSDDE